VEDCEYLTSSANSFLLDVIFKNCVRQFAQFYSLQVHLGNTSHDTYIYTVTFALLPNKKETTCQLLLTPLTIWCSFWSLKIIKVDFEAAFINAIDSLSGLSYYWL
jgi:hypothetical protein